MANEAVLVNPTRKIGAFEKRVHEVDFVRGILILLVLFDHIMNAFLLHSQEWAAITHNPGWLDAYKFFQWYWDSIPRNLVRYICLSLFCFISGVSSAFSKNNWKRAGELLVVFALINVGSNLLNAWKIFGDTAMIIDFNVIGVLAFSTLFYCFVQNQSWKGLLASTLLWFLFSKYGMDIINSNPASYFANVPSLLEPHYIFADWMPIVPYIVCFFLGALFSYFFYQERKSLLPRHEFERPICFVGRYTLWIYLAHQAVLVPLFMLITAILRGIYGA